MDVLFFRSENRSLLELIFVRSCRNEFSFVYLFSRIEKFCNTRYSLRVIAKLLLNYFSNSVCWCFSLMNGIVIKIDSFLML